MNFDEAIKRAKNGEKIRRTGWNVKRPYVELETCISCKNADGDTVNCNHDAIGNLNYVFVSIRGMRMGWLPSPADMLADDWETVKEA